MEDIIEEIMGDIRDEHDKEIEGIEKIDENNYTIDGMLDIDSVAEKLNIPEDVEQVTIGGYVFNLLGKEPVVGDSVVDENFIFEVLEVDGMRIKTIKATKLQDDNNTEDGDSQ